MRAGWIRNCFVPVEPILNAAIRLRLRRGLGCAQMKEMLPVPVDALTFDQILEKLDALEIRLNALAAIAR
jgi:hypothetical protein